MRRRGVTYDTGFIHLGVSTRATFASQVVRREMQIIAEDLHLDAVRVTGGDPDRLELAASYAAEAGLEVWYCPFTCDLTQDALLGFLDDAAQRAEVLRRGGAGVVFVTGSEISLFTRGFLSGDTLEERLALLARPQSLREQRSAIQAQVNVFLDRAVRLVRERFGGSVTYASVPLDGVDWTPFDFVSTDAAYASREVADRYREGIRALAGHGKPVAITEFGCTTYRGASGNVARGDPRSGPFSAAERVREFR